MAIVYTNLTLGLTKQNSTLTIEMPQGDNGRGLDVFVSDDIIIDEQSTVDNTLSADLWVVKPSGLMVSMSASSVSRFENSDAYEIQFSDTEAFQQVLAEEGVVKAEISLMSGVTYISSFKFNIKVTNNIAMAETITSKEEYKNIQECISTVRSYTSVLEEYVKQFQNQLKLTVNVRSGVNDPSVLETDKVGDLYIKYEEV